MDTLHCTEQGPLLLLPRADVTIGDREGLRARYLPFLGLPVSFVCHPGLTLFCFCIPLLTYFQQLCSGYGKVYMSKFLPDKTTVAVKRVPYVNPKDRRKALQEVRFLRYCGVHPNILSIHRAHLVKDELWMIMEFLEGATLMQAVSIHRFSEIQIAYLARYMLKAILFLHENQIAHRDLKSSNVMLTLNGAVKIIDLGLCTDVSQGAMVHMVGSVRTLPPICLHSLLFEVVCSNTPLFRPCTQPPYRVTGLTNCFAFSLQPFWMPPEMIRKEPHGLPADIWSFAICLMEVANGRLPHRKSSMLAMFKAATEGFSDPLDLPRKWSSSFLDFLRKCLIIDPSQRAIAQELYQHPWLNRRARRSDMKLIFAQIHNAALLSQTT